MRRNLERESVAHLAAQAVQSRFQLPTTLNVPNGSIGLILGTGWGSSLPVKDALRIPAVNIPGFIAFNRLEGHARELAIGMVAGRRVFVWRGRIHLNEAPADPEIYNMVRLQTELLLQLGVRRLILTSAVGSLPTGVKGMAQGSSLPVGSICVVDGFVSVYAPRMPVWAGEFCSPEDTLDAVLQRIALEEKGELEVLPGGHVMVCGPSFEGRKYDKDILAATGAKVVGMSLLPEACVAALYDAKVLALGFVTNDAVETHSHEENLARAKAASAQLGGYLTRIISRIDRDTDLSGAI